jgi:hypothetical protein
MDPIDTNGPEEEVTGAETVEPGNGELSHSDKMIGVFSEPAKMFDLTSKFPPRHKDWVIPIIILMVLVGITRTISMMNEEVFLEAKQKQIAGIEKMVENGTLTQEQGDQAIDRIDQQMEFMRGPVGWVINIVSTLIFGTLFFIIIAGIYFLFIKFLLKGEGTFASALVASGLVGYISIIQVIIAAILTMAFGKIVEETSLAALMGSNKSTIIGWLYGKIDPISIWAYIVLSIGLAKMFKSKSTGKYYALVFGLWLVGTLLFFFVAKAVPFLGFLNR